MKLPIIRLDHAAGLDLPAYQSALSAGMDLIAAVDAAEPVELARGGRSLVPTGLIVEIPAGFEGQVRPRSGLAYKHGVTVLNAPGTIDADYRGELKVLLINHGNTSFQITRGLRVAQLIIAPVVQATPIAADDISTTERGTGGFGSTGQ